MVNVGKYTIHVSYGNGESKNVWNQPSSEPNMEVILFMEPPLDKMNRLWISKFGLCSTGIVQGELYNYPWESNTQYDRMIQLIPFFGSVYYRTTNRWNLRNFCLSKPRKSKVGLEQCCWSRQGFKCWNPIISTKPIGSMYGMYGIFTYTTKIRLSCGQKISVVGKVSIDQQSPCGPRGTRWRLKASSCHSPWVPVTLVAPLKVGRLGNNQTTRQNDTFCNKRETLNRIELTKPLVDGQINQTPNEWAVSSPVSMSVVGGLIYFVHSQPCSEGTNNIEIRGGRGYGCMTRFD